MAKPLGAKALLIREAITAHPDMGNTELAEAISGSDARKQDKISVKASDVAQQRQAMKKSGLLSAAKGGKKRGRPAAPTAPRSTAPPQASPVDLIDRVFDLAAECGGMDQLRRLVERLT